MYVARLIALWVFGLIAGGIIGGAFGTLMTWISTLI